MRLLASPTKYSADKSNIFNINTLKNTFGYLYRIYEDTHDSS
jgi:hypothetical protein